MRHTGSLRPQRHSRALPAFCSLIASGFIASSASAQWASFINDTSARIVGDPAVTTTDPEEKDFAWADLDNDGDTDLVCVRKTPFTFAGGRRNVLYMNEGGVLVDRASTLANTSINVPPGEITAANGMSPAIPGWLGSSQGFLDPTNDRDVVIDDVNNDGWLDVVTATTISDVNNSNQPYFLPRFLGHPRVYMNLGEVAGVWQGLQYNYNAIPQLVSKSGTPWHPRFCSVGIGDVTGDGYADLYFGDYDSAEVGPDEPFGTDMDNKLLINVGASNPGVFVDQSVMRMGSIFNYPDSGAGNYLVAAFGAASVIADMNGDGHKDVVKQTGLTPPQHVAVVYNNPASVGVFNNYKIVTPQSPYFVSVGDLNQDDRLDLVITDDNADHYHLNQGNDAQNAAIFSNAVFGFPGGGGDDGFGSQSVVADLNNDGFNDVVIADVDVDGFGCGRRMHIYHNLGDLPNVTLQEESPSIIPTNMLQGTHNVAVFDINGDDFNDMVIGRCNSTQVWINTGVTIAPESTPLMIDPDGADIFVNIQSSSAADIVKGSPTLLVSTNGGPYIESPMADQGGGMFAAHFPSGECGEGLRYYYRVQADIGASTPTFTLPFGAPDAHFTAIRGTSIATIVDEAFEGSTAQWTVNSVALTGGAWQAADPNGTIAGGGLAAAPSDDSTPAPGVIAFVTQNGFQGGGSGAADVDGGPTHLVSPAFDATGGSFRISYNYWFFTDNASLDTLTVSLSNDDGNNWTVAKTYAASSGGWKNDSITVDSVLPGTNQVRVRFSAQDGGAASVVEAGVDDFHFEEIGCDTPCFADVNNDSSVNVNDLLSVITSWGACVGTCPPACPSDVAPAGTGDCNVNVNDLLLVITSWGACSS